MNTLRYIWDVLQGAISSFFEEQCVRYSAALSFFALFSLAPMILIAVQVAGFLAENIDFQEQVIEQFSQLVGSQGAQGIEILMESLEDEEASIIQIVIGTVVLLFSATSIFVQLQTSFNNIYSVRVKEGKNILKQFVSRLISLGMILSLGFIMITSLIIDSAIRILESYIGYIFQNLTSFILIAVQYFALIGLVYLVIYALFNFLPDVTIKNKFKVRGSIFVTLLLVFGKFAIGWYIGNSQFSELGGASASVIVLMVWIYYSSLILFFGACLIKSMARVENMEISPRRFAIRIKSIEVRKE